MGSSGRSLGHWGHALRRQFQFSCDLLSSPERMLQKESYWFHPVLSASDSRYNLGPACIPVFTIHCEVTQPQRLHYAIWTLNFQNCEPLFFISSLCQVFHYSNKKLSNVLKIAFFHFFPISRALFNKLDVLWTWVYLMMIHG